MAGGGYYPTMMDVEWNNAPWNEAPIRVCPICDGEGGFWCDGRRYITPIEYDKLSEDEQEWFYFEKCKECDGTGVI